MLVIDLIEHIPGSTHYQVKTAYKRFGQVIREAIRSETRLRLIPRQNDYKNSSARGEVRVSVDTVGYPKQVGAIEISPEHKLSAILSLWQPLLINLQNTAHQIDLKFKEPNGEHAEAEVRFILKMLPEIHTLIPSLENSAKLAEILLKRIKNFDIVEHILKVNEDILGIYRFHYDPHVESSGYVEEEVRGNSKGQIKIYWGVIGLCAMALHLPVADLTAVVLAHELAHAYTHLGYDIDDYRWPALQFRNSDHEVKEGLAQYYTERVMDTLKDKIPGGLSAYKALLKKQPPAYHEHSSWIDHSTPEAVRNTLILLRRNQPIKKHDFGEYLFDTTADYAKT